MSDLTKWGFESFFGNQLDSDETGVPARVAAEHRGGYEVWAAEGSGFAELTGKLRSGLAGNASPGVGDWVVLKAPPGPDRTTVIERVLERKTVFIRGAAGREARGQVVAANVDTVFAVCGLDSDYNLHRIERYLARIWASGANPVVVLN